MDKIVRRVTVIQVDSGERTSAVVYKKSGQSTRARRKTTPMLRPIERAVRHVLKAGSVGSDAAFKRHRKSSAKRRNGWLMDAPSNMIKVNRKAFNEFRKGVPFRVLPRAN